MKYKSTLFGFGVGLFIDIVMSYQMGFVFFFPMFTLLNMGLGNALDTDPLTIMQREEEGG